MIIRLLSSHAAPDSDRTSRSLQLLLQFIGVCPQICVRLTLATLRIRPNNIGPGNASMTLDNSREFWAQS